MNGVGRVMEQVQSWARDHRRWVVPAVAGVCGLSVVTGAWYVAEQVLAEDAPRPQWGAIVEAQPVPAASQTPTPSAPVTPPPAEPQSEWQLPAEGPYTSGFGMRMHPILKVMKLHTGLDIGAPCGAPVRASLDGTVTLVADNDGFGLRVRVDHGSHQVGGQEAPVTTMYAHLSTAGVREGERVLRGQVIGQVGDSGLSEGCHLHFETVVLGEPVDPLTVTAFGNHPLPQQEYQPLVRAKPKPSPSPSASTAPSTAPAAPGPARPAPVAAQPTGQAVPPAQVAPPVQAA
ncbi:MAG: M23 family metallopeptidase, partial [Actinomycetia bacterium]|nr:M23 family metallopeptidase [Actinomycetes bacterium]